MALDLFANYERSSNSSEIYRLTSPSPYTVSIKLSDLSLPDEQLGNFYYAASSINNEPFKEFKPSLVRKTFETLATFNCATPCICSITVAVSTANPNFVPVSTYTLSAKFVDNIPTATFVAYPSAAVVLGRYNIPKIIYFNTTNYTQSSGVFFYGEGHTENINLSSSLTTSALTANWFVGNDVQTLNSPNKISHFPITKNLANNGSTATVAVSSALDEETQHSISLMITNSSIPSSAPIKTYIDSTGELMFYPYFISTKTVNSENNPLNNKLKQDVSVLKYQTPTNLNFKSPFSSNLINLPFDYSSTSFKGQMNNPAASGVAEESFYGSRWSVGGVSDAGDWGGDGDSFAGTDFLPGFLGYKFNLAYDKNQPLDYFRASVFTPTTITLHASGYKTALINLPPYDWKKKIYSQTFEASTTVNSIPFSNLYTPNYYNVKGSPVTVTYIEESVYPFDAEIIELKSNSSPTTVVLSGDVISGDMIFDEVGLASLSATITFKNSLTNQREQTTIEFSSLIEVVNQYDTVNENYFRTNLTPINLNYSEAPKISPNEWAIADNVNSVITKIYNLFDQLNSYTLTYEPKNKFYGWLGIKSRAQTLGSQIALPTYVWYDLECNQQQTTSDTTWANFENESLTATQLTWQFHECEESVSDPSCLGKYCIEWKWNSRRCGESELNTRWEDLKFGAPLVKKWKYERCESDSPFANCARDTWKLSTIDGDYFPLPSCGAIDRCKIIDVDFLNTKKNIIIAYPREINLLNNDYYASFLARRSFADELFVFQNIVAIATNSNERTFVLDNVLSKVSVFDVVDNNFKFITSWGIFGLKNNPQGINNPSDIHIDKKGFVWIADTGNKCVKKFTSTGKNEAIIEHSDFENNPPLSICVDSTDNLHCLTARAIYVFNSDNLFLFSYDFAEDITRVSKINTSYNREMIYLTHNTGIFKYFRTGKVAEYVMHEYKCKSKQILTGFSSIIQDRFRNLYVTVGDKILKVQDLMSTKELKGYISPELFWKLNDLLVHKEEYIQPWVYLKSFHRLWDNIELFRSSLQYENKGCKQFSSAIYQKEDLVIGQNEIVTNAVVNRIAGQLWANLQSLIDYFDPNCKK